MHKKSHPTLKQLYESVLSRYASQVALQYNGETLTYGRLAEQSARLANAMHELGRTEGDRVGLVMSNRPEYAVADVGLTRAGLAKVPMNDMLSADNFEHMLRNSGASAVIVGPRFVDTIKQIAPNLPSLEQIITIGETANTSTENGYYSVPLQTLLETHSASVPEVSVSGDSLAGVFHTGGTTGDPKGVKHTQVNLALNAIAHAIELDIKPRDRLLLTTPLPHSAGLIMAGGLTQGSTHVIRQGFDAEQALEIIEQEEISWTFMVPTMIYRVLDLLDSNEHDTSTLETLTYGAAPMKPDRLREGIEQFGNVFVQLYGQYETPDLITVLPKSAHDPENEERLSSCGIPTSMCEVTVVDDGEPVAPGEPGEILARGAYTMEGYYEMPEKTAETMNNGWVHTGDIGKMDEDGYVYILDRDSDVIVTGGMNVYSVTVEEVIQQHDQVANVAVVGVPHDEWGEAVKAIIVSEGSTIDQDDLWSFCADRLADYELPKSFDIVEELPTTPYGKLDKKRLREPYWEKQSRKIS